MTPNFEKFIGCYGPAGARPPVMLFLVGDSVRLAFGGMSATMSLDVLRWVFGRLRAAGLEGF
jgi:hypothetical protein